MKSIKKVVLTTMAKTAFQTAKLEADSACFCFFYQPAMPKKVKELKKKK